MYYRKQTFWDSWSFLLLPLLIATPILAALFYLLLNQEKAYSVPAQFCTEQYTGREREEVHMQCNAINNNPCGMQTPVYTTYREVVVTCKPFALWR